QDEEENQTFRFGCLRQLKRVLDIPGTSQAGQKNAPIQVLPNHNNDVDAGTPNGVLLDDNNFEVDAGTPNVMLSDDNNDAGTHNDIVLFDVKTEEEAVGTPGEGQEETNEEASDLSLPNANTKDSMLRSIIDLPRLPLISPPRLQSYEDNLEQQDTPRRSTRQRKPAKHLTYNSFGEPSLQPVCPLYQNPKETN
uniref:Uncharacterized protein n=2 Tax=Clytia hemisphaerica TaxID=252671 RepID=A0A7M5WUH2_9CNID